MLKRTCFTILAVGLSLGAGCPVNNNPANNLVPHLWSEVYGNNENTGFNFVHTPFAVPSSIAWTADVGPLSFSAPVVGPDGLIWVTNTNGELVGLNPDGSEHRRRQLDEAVIASPAINPGTNEIFVVGERTIDPVNFDYASRIYRLDSGTTLLNVSDAPLRTGAAPKLWSTFLFIPSGSALQVYDQVSLSLIGKADATPCFNIVCGNLDLFDEIFEATIECWLTLSLSGTCPFKFSPIQLIGPEIEPSVAVIDAADVVGDASGVDGDTSKPIIVVVSPVCACGFRFHPAGDSPTSIPGIDPQFELLWSHALVEVDCDFQTVRSTTPVAVANGAVVFGDEHGRVLALDARTGEQLWEQNLNEPVQCPPVTNTLRQIYVVEATHLATLDSTGALLDESPLIGTGLSAAVSIDFVYVGTTKGVHSFGATEQAFGIAQNPPHPGASFVSLAPDDTLYVSSPSLDSTVLDGLVVAYVPQGPAIAPLVVPQVAWQTPTDGATISSAPGQKLTVTLPAVGGSAFDGHVTFTSNLDGTLCDVAAHGPTATCSTSQALSIDTHTLTAFATDSGGGTRSASITVQVADTPPTVAMSSPAANAILSEGSIAFTAQVTDPDESPFPPASVQWKSSIDGVIGTGLSFNRKLSLGTHTITATATDASGLTGSATVTIQVTEGPVVTIQQPANNAVFKELDVITFTAKVVDTSEPNFPASHVKWQSSLDGAIGTGLSVSKALSLGTHTITATATDAGGITGSATVTILVTEGPVVTIGQPTEDAVFSDIEVITFAATIVDTSEPDFPADGVKWTSDIDGDLGTGPTITHKLSVGNHTITVTATDSHGFSGQARVHVRVIGN